MDNLTPLDARNSLLLDRPRTGGETSMFSVSSTFNEKSGARPNSQPRYTVPAEDALRPMQAPSRGPTYRALTPTAPGDASQRLMQGAAPLGYMDARQPTLPDMGQSSQGYQGQYGAAYRYPSGGYQGV